MIEFTYETGGVYIFRQLRCLLVSMVSSAGTTRGKRVGRIASGDELIAERINWKRGGSRVVFVHGVFDLLHPGHVRLLEQARSLGNVLVVAVHGDARDHSKNAATVAGARDRESKSLRSVTPSAERAEIVAALAAVDFVTEIDPSGIAEFVERLRPGCFGEGRDFRRKYSSR